MVVRETSSSRKKKNRDYCYTFKKNPVAFICLPRFYSSSSVFLSVSPPPSSLTTDHERSKYVHEVKQSVNLWNTLAMRSASLYSFQLQKKNKNRRRGEKKTQCWPPLQRGYSISMSFFISHWWIIQGDLPTTEWERKRGRDKKKKKKKKGENNWGGMQR